MADIPEWLTYEHQAIEQHAETYPEAAVHHWSGVPETMLTDAGYIHEINRWRLDRKRRFNPDEPSPNPLSDYGLDGLARVADDEYHGIQAKRRKTGSYLRAKDIATFMAVTQRMRVKHPESRGFLYTDSKLTRELADDLTLLPGYEVVHMHLAISAAVEMPVVPAAAVEPWPHQLEAVAALRAWDEPRGVFVMPPGSGKTMVMGIWGRENARVVVCSPTRALAAQTLEAMARLMPDHRRLLIDSDTAGTRDTATVAAAWADETPLLISTTYASMCDTMAGVVTPDTVIMVDEGHHLAGNAQLRTATESLECRVLIVTGTPPAALLDDNDDDDLPIVYQYHYDRAVQEGRICDYRIYLPLISDPVGDRDHDDLVHTLSADLTSRCHFLANGLLRTGATRCIVYAASVAEADAYRVALPRLAAQFHGIAAWTGLITGETSTGQRDQQLGAFQAYDPMFRWFFLCSVRVLDEGVDVPACDAIYIANSIGTESRFVQRMCRANRLGYPGKVANVFVWADDIDLDVALRATARVASTLNATSRTSWATKVAYVSTDYAHIVEPAINARLVERVCILCVKSVERWHLRLQQIREFLVTSNGRRPSHVASDLIERRLGSWFNTQVYHYDPTCATKSKQSLKDETAHAAWSELRHLHPRLFEKVGESWHRSLQETEAFIIKFNKRPSSTTNVEERRLHHWLANQGSIYNAEGSDKSQRTMKDPVIHAAWTSFLKRHASIFMDNKQRWRESARASELIMSVSKKKPGGKLGTWISTQLRTHNPLGPTFSKWIMREDDIHSEWALLLNRHPMIFK
jgi:superfamily II DNA or RNA helicase